MFFRFFAALGLVVAVSVTGIHIEKRNLQLRRQLSRQQYRLDVLLEEHARLRLTTQQLGTPQRLLDSMDEKKLKTTAPAEIDRSAEAGRPLLRWQRKYPRAD